MTPVPRVSKILSKQNGIPSEGLTTLRLDNLPGYITTEKASSPIISEHPLHPERFSEFETV